MCEQELRKGLKISTGSVLSWTRVINPHASGQSLIMWIRNLWTAYFISCMFLAPSKLCMQTKLGLKDFPCVCNTGPNWMRLFFPCCWSHSSWCDQPQTTLLRGVTLHKWQEEGLLLASLLTSAFFFFLKDTDLSLFADFQIPTLCVWERKEWEEKQRWLTMISPEGAFCLPFFLCQRW